MNRVKLDTDRYSPRYFRQEIRRVNKNLRNTDYGKIKTRAELLSQLVKVLPDLSDEFLEQLIQTAKVLATLHPLPEIPKDDIPF